ncbi:DUF3139 domain-containing protein [Sporosarcina ureae]|uniref:DUF3139 domain-containing protein n=1 Tax=Sporosarcina ureae TaxID=1571 RepID=UPI0026EF2F38|nr:DUF3139 domain-containing protein [Sporosarcina ureae]
MSPASLIYFTILMAPILLLLIAAVFWKKARIILLIAAVIVASAETYYVLYSQDASLQKWYEREDTVNAYLKETYPEDEWVSRQAVRNTILSDGVEVVFIDEPEVAYLYIIEDGNVQLAGYSERENAGEPKRDR